MSMPERAPCARPVLELRGATVRGFHLVPRQRLLARVPGPAPQSGSNSSSGPAARYGSVSVPDPPELFRPGALGLRATSAGAFVQ